MSHHEEEGKNPSTSSGRGKKSGFVKAIFKLLTLGGLLVIVFKALQKQKGNQDNK